VIVFELICPKNHRFEGWFASAGDFDGQRERGLLSCPSCGHSHIDKLPTAKIRKANQELLPAVRETTVPDQAKPQPQVPAHLQELIDYVLLNTDNVGKAFADEARRMHRQEAPYRNIRGTTSRVEAEDLLEEGIPVMALPIPPQNDWH
jgi:hypothetical protein